MKLFMLVFYLDTSRTKAKETVKIFLLQACLKNENVMDVDDLQASEGFLMM